MKPSPDPIDNSTDEQQMEGLSTGDNELSVSQAELVERISWLIMLRWFAVGGVAATILIARKLFISRLPWGLLCLVTLAILVYNVFFYLVWHRTARKAEHIERTSSWIANAQITCDLFALALLIHFSGGVENPFGFYFLFHMVITSILLSPRAAFVQATFAILLFVGIALGEFHGILSHYNSPINTGQLDLHGNSIYVFSATWVLCTSLYVTVYLTTSIAKRLKYREDQVKLLSHRVMKHNEMLQVAYDKLAELEKLKSAYTRKVAHEMRSPLAAIESLLQVVADGLVGEVSKPALEKINRARQRIIHLLEVVNDLLVLAATREAASKLKRSPIHPGKVLEEVISLLASQADARRIHLDIKVEPDVPDIYADPEGLSEMLCNLISNAIKYSPDEATVSAYVSTKGSYVNFEITDSGIGIAEEDKDKIFLEFYRAENARAFTEQGTGIGLAIVKNVADAHSGKITIESKPGFGTRFNVQIPIHP